MNAEQVLEKLRAQSLLVLEDAAAETGAAMSREAKHTLTGLAEAYLHHMAHELECFAKHRSKAGKTVTADDVLLMARSMPEELRDQLREEVASTRAAPAARPAPAAPAPPATDAHEPSASQLPLRTAYGAARPGGDHVAPSQDSGEPLAKRMRPPPPTFELSDDEGAPI
ncbi:unnamed protein product [Pedinophyceae sp. YPF-701]|nr:unnamed protein product [Pedinophyceae sp. YPF-701]